MDETPFVKVPSTLSASPQGRTEKPSRYAVFTGKMKRPLPDFSGRALCRLTLSRRLPGVGHVLPVKEKTP